MLLACYHGTTSQLLLIVLLAITVLFIMPAGAIVWIACGCRRKYNVGFWSAITISVLGSLFLFVVSSEESLKTRGLAAFFGWIMLFLITTTLVVKGKKPAAPLDFYLSAIAPAFFVLALILMNNG